MFGGSYCSSEPVYKPPRRKGYSSVSDDEENRSFFWSDAADQAFEALKKQLAELPILAAPIDKEPLLLYVAANSRAVSVAIVVERKESCKEYPV